VGGIGGDTGGETVGITGMTGEVVTETLVGPDILVSPKPKPNPKANAIAKIIIYQ
jgi:hypothetical protein